MSEEHNLLFEAFKMGHKAGKRSITTVGLAEAREIVENLDCSQRMIEKIREALLLILDELDGLKQKEINK